MKVALLSLALIAFTFAMWGAFVWLFGEYGIIGVVITGFTLPIWAPMLLGLIGVDDD